MIKLEIGNSYSRITGLNPKQEQQLRNELSYTVGGSSAYFSGYGIRRKSLLTKRGELPTGLLHRLTIKPDTVVDNRIKPRSTPQGLILKGSPYQWQLNAVKAAERVNRGIITAPTGTGKSMAIMLLITRVNVKTLIVVPTVEIRRQMQELVDSCGLSKKVDVENIDSKALKTKKSYGMLIIDEGHHVAASTYQKLNKQVWNDIYYRFYFTATPFRNDTEETLLFEAIAGQVIYKLDYKTAIREKYIVPVEAYYVDLPKLHTDAYTWNEVYKELIVNRKDRNELIKNLIINLVVRDKSCLCLVKEVVHGKNIEYPSFVHGQDEESRRLIELFNKGILKGLIGTEGVISEGVDTKPCEYIILAGLGKAKSRIMQAIGRSLRNYPGKEAGKIILFKDSSHKFTLRHFKEQCKVLKMEYGVKPIKLDI